MMFYFGINGQMHIQLFIIQDHTYALSHMRAQWLEELSSKVATEHQ